MERGESDNLTTFSHFLTLLLSYLLSYTFTLLDFETFTLLLSRSFVCLFSCIHFRLTRVHFFLLGAWHIYIGRDRVTKDIVTRNEHCQHISPYFASSSFCFSFLFSCLFLAKEKFLFPHFSPPWSSGRKAAKTSKKRRARKDGQEKTSKKRDSQALAATTLFVITFGRCVRSFSFFLPFLLSVTSHHYITTRA